VFRREAVGFAIGARILIAALALALAMPVTSPTLAQSLTPPGGPAIGGQLQQAIADLKQTDVYKNATPLRRSGMLARAVKAVIVAALESGASTATIASALNTAVRAGVITGAIAVQAASLAALQLARSDGAEASQAAGLAAAVQLEPAVRTSLISDGSNVVVHWTNTRGQTVTALISLSSFLSAAASSSVTFDDSLSASATNTTAVTYNPCIGVVADYC
jgi:hypothetical protein